MVAVLPWMSIGYETQVPPISTVTFYNAIANDGKMMRPRFIKKIMKNGEVIREFPPEVIKEQIAKQCSFKDIVICEARGISTMYANEGGIIAAF
mgnify:CR=1 FL=1